MTKWPTSEVELARVVVAWLQDLQWDVYQEVQIDTYGSCADIVARQGNLIWIVECKKTVCFEVLAQAENWRGHAHYTSICVPRISDRSFDLTRKLLKMTGIGCITANEHGYCGETFKARLNRHADIKPVVARLNEQMKTYAEAGNSDGRRWTPFKSTCDAVREYVEANPGCDFKAMLGSVETHYSSTSTARSSLAHWAKAGKIQGVRLVRDGRRLRLYPECATVEANASLFAMQMHE